MGQYGCWGKVAEFATREAVGGLTMVTVASALTTIHLIVFASSVPRSAERLSVVWVGSSSVSLTETIADFSIFRDIESYEQPGVTLL